MPRDIIHIHIHATPATGTRNHLAAPFLAIEISGLDEQGRAHIGLDDARRLAVGLLEAVGSARSLTVLTAEGAGDRP